MNQSFGNAYFENQIVTASPQRRQFLLLDSALKAARKAEGLLTSGAPAQASVELAHCEAILAAIVGAMRKDVAPELVEKASAVYAFMLGRLADAHLNDDVQTLREAIRVLEFERDTWRQASEGVQVDSPSVSAPHLSLGGGATAAYEGGLTLEA